MLKTTTKLMPNITNSTSVINKSTTSPQSIYNPTTTTSPPTTTATKTNITIHKSSSNPNILSPTSNQVYQLNVPTSYHQIIPAAVNSTTVTYNQAPQQPHQQQQINNSTLYVPSLNNSILNQSSSLSFPSSTSSSMIPSNPYGSSNLSQPNNGWYFDSLLVDNVDDFLPWSHSGVTSPQWTLFFKLFNLIINKKRLHTELALSLQGAVVTTHILTKGAVFNACTHLSTVFSISLSLHTCIHTYNWIIKRIIIYVNFFFVSFLIIFG